MRRIGIGAVAALLVAGCAGSDEPATSPASPTATTWPASTEAVATDTATALEPTSSPTAVGVDVMLAGEGVDAALGLAVAAGEADQTDPFGSFASCSGLRRSVGTYSVLVADPEGAVVRSVSALTVDRVEGPGIYDADIRIERAAAVPIRATGTLTLSAGLQDGSFVAFDAAGVKYEGTFACTGVDDRPVPLAEGRPDGVLDTVEVFALLRQGQSERVLGLAVDAELAAAECRGAVGGSGPVIVRVDGDSGLGAITTFELTGGAEPTVRLRVGGASFEVADPVTTIDAAGTAGTFTGSTASGVDVDGAFRCT